MRAAFIICIILTGVAFQFGFTWIGFTCALASAFALDKAD